MLKALLTGLVLSLTASGAFAGGSGACGVGYDTSVMAENALDGVLDLIASGVARPT